MAKTPQFLSSVWEKLTGLLASLKQSILSLWRRIFKSKSSEVSAVNVGEPEKPATLAPIVKTSPIEQPVGPSLEKQLEVTVLVGPGAQKTHTNIQMPAQEGETVCKLLYRIMAKNQRTHLFDIKSIANLTLISHGRRLPADAVLKADHFDESAKIHVVVSDPLDVFKNVHQGLEVILGGKKEGERCLLFYNMAHKLLGYKLPHPKLKKLPMFKCTHEECAQQLEQYAEIVPADSNLSYAFKTLAVALKDRYPSAQPKLSR